MAINIEVLWNLFSNFRPNILFPSQSREMIALFTARKSKSILIESLVVSNNFFHPYLQFCRLKRDLMTNKCSAKNYERSFDPSLFHMIFWYPS